VDPLDTLSPVTRTWFERAFGSPTPAQQLAWPAIAAGGHVLVQAPTGSGKTLAAFLLGLDRLNERPGEGMRLLYVSPLKALNYDIERNLRGPLTGIGSPLAVGVRTGDTPQRDRERMLRTPPDILITTPESLYLLLTSRGRDLLKTVETVILDEVHALAGTKRGVHLSLSLERLERVAEQPFQRIGLSATQRPLAEIGRWVAGPDREIALVDAGQRKELDLEVVVPVEDMRELGASRQPLAQPVVQDGVEMDSGYEASARSIWPSIYPALLELVRAHRSTIVFVNNRRLAERLALRINEIAEAEVARAHHGSLAREQRLLIEEDLKAGRIPASSPPRASSSASTWAPSTSSSRSRARSRSPADCSGSAGPGTSWVRRRRAGSSRSSGQTCSSVPSSRRRCATARSRRPRSRGTRSTCSPSRSLPSARRRRSRWTTCTGSSAARTPSLSWRVSSSRTFSTCCPGATRPTSSPSSGPASSGTARVV
jgi:Lhr-like helicase